MRKKIMFSLKDILVKDIFQGFLVILSIFMLFFYPSFHDIKSYLPSIYFLILSIILFRKIIFSTSAKRYAYYAIFTLFYNLLISIIFFNLSFYSIVLSTIRIFFPVIGLVLGNWLACKYKGRNIKIFILFFLIIQFLIVYLQINNFDFRQFTFKIYRGVKSDSYLESFFWSTGQRAIGSIGNPNSLGLIFVLFNIFLLLYPDDSSSKVNTFLFEILSLIITSYVCIYTQSRTAMIVFIFTVVIWYLYSFNNSKSILFKLSLSIIMLSMIAILLNNWIYREISLSGLDSRNIIWKARIRQMITEFGMGKFSLISGIGFNNARSLGFYDNIYLKTLISNGIFGFIFYVFVQLSFIDEILKISKGKNRLLGVIVLLIWFFGSVMMDYNEIFSLSILTFAIIGFTLKIDRVGV